MSCGCYGGDAEYNNLCNADTPYPQISSESVPSLIGNLTLALYGEFTKSVDQATGRIVWNVPCTPQATPIRGIAPNAGEGMICYIARVLNTLPQVARAWMSASLVVGAVTVGASYGMSVTKTGTGQYSVVFSTPMSAPQYATQISIGRASSQTTGFVVSAKTTSGFTLTIYGNGSAQDISGDLNILIHAN